MWSTDELPDSQAEPLFPLGQIVATPGALDLLDRAAVNSADLLKRHQHGDWGAVLPEDAEENVKSVANGWRVMSVYYLNESERIWVITEADRSATTLLLPFEY